MFQNIFTFIGLSIVFSSGVSDSFMIRLSLTQPNKSIHFGGGWPEGDEQTQEGENIPIQGILSEYSLEEAD